MIEDSIKPKDPEILEAEKICEEMREIAKGLPKPSEATSKGPIEEFENNFYLLFQGIELQKEQPDSIFVKNYLRRAERIYGEKWEKFINDKADLVARTAELAYQVFIYHKLHQRFTT